MYFYIVYIIYIKPYLFIYVRKIINLSDISFSLSVSRVCMYLCVYEGDQKKAYNIHEDSKYFLISYKQ